MCGHEALVFIVYFFVFSRKYAGTYSWLATLHAVRKLLLGGLLQDCRLTENSITTVFIIMAVVAVITRVRSLSLSRITGRNYPVKCKW